jgi:hypothetical protein
MGARVDARVEQVTFSTPLRWLGAAAVWAVIAATVATMRHRARKPTVPPMSEEWLRSHAADRRWDY